MAKVVLVQGVDLIRVTPQSEDAVGASFPTWTEAMAYCKTKKYVVMNEEVAEERCQGEMDARDANRHDIDDQGGEGTDA